MAILSASQSAALSAFLALPPAERFELRSALTAAIYSAEYPRLTVGTDEEGRPALIGPDGEVVSVDSLVSIDVSERWTPARADGVDHARRVVAFRYGEGEGDDYEGLTYALNVEGAGLIPVRLPVGWTEG